MNMQKDCGSIEAERRMGSGAYEPAFSVPGSVDNKMDAAATENMTYAYRLRCKKVSAFSAYRAIGSGADVMKRIAAPMVGGLVTSAFLTLEIIPVISTYWRQEQLLWQQLEHWIRHDWPVSGWRPPCCRRALRSWV